MNSSTLKILHPIDLANILTCLSSETTTVLGGCEACAIFKILSSADSSPAKTTLMASESSFARPLFP